MNGVGRADVAFKSNLPPAERGLELEPQPVRRGNIADAARAGLDVPRSLFVLYLIATRRIGQGDLVADRGRLR